MAKAKLEKVGIELKRVLLHPDEPPKPISKFVYAVAGNEIALEVDYYDVRDLHLTLKAAKEGAKVRSKLYITDRFVLTPAAALDMLVTATSLVEFLKSHGLLPPNALEELEAFEATNIESKDESTD